MSAPQDDNSGRRDSFGEEGGKKKKKIDRYVPNYGRRDSSREAAEEAEIDRYMPEYGETVERRQLDRYVPDYDSAATGADDSTTTTTTQPDDPTRQAASAHSRDDRDNRPNPWSSFRHYPRPRRRHRSSPDYLTGSLHPSSLPPPRNSRNRRDPISPPPPYTQTPESPYSRNPRPLRAAATSWRDRGSNRPPRSQPSGNQPPESVELERSIHRRVYPPRRPSRSLSPRSRSSRHVGQAQAQTQAQHDGSPSSFASDIAAAAAENDDSRRRPFQNAPGATNAYNPPPPAPPNQQQQWRSSSPSSTIAPRRAPYTLPRRRPPREQSAGTAYTTDFEVRRAGGSSSSSSAAAAAGENDGSSYDQRMITPSANLYDPAYSRRFTSSNLPLRGRPPPRVGGPSRGGGPPPARRSGEGNSNSDSAYSSDAGDFELLTFKSPPNRRAGR